MDISNLEGIVPILLTPLTEQGDVDEQGVKHLVEFCVEKEFNGLVVLGSNGEFPYLSFEEKRQVMAAAALAAKGRIPVIATASAFGTDQAVALAKEAEKAGCDAVMAAMPIYFRLDLESVIRHFEAIAREGGLPVFFYYFPEVTGLVLKPEEIRKIAAIEGVTGAKITVVNKSFLKKVIEQTRDLGWKVFTGTSFLLNHCLESGGAGAFCPLPLIAPDMVKGIYQAHKKGDKTRSREIQKKLLNAIPLMSGIDMTPGILSLGFRILTSMPYRGPGKRSPATHHLLKEVLRIQGHPITSSVKPPFKEPTRQETEFITRSLKALLGT
jgi:4-hydroxy-tetrahydrodipicolinate synthase